MANSYNNTITPHTQKSAVDGVPDQQSASINPFALLGLGAALNLVEKEEAIADFTASAIASAMCVKFGAIVLRQDMKSEKHVFGQLNNAPIKSEVAQEIQSFLSNSPVTTQTIGLEFCNEITVNRETLPELSCHGLRRLLLLRLRTLDNDYGMILAGKGNNKSFTAVQRAALQALGSETSLALHRLQLNEERAANETALRESENRFRLLVERAGDAIFLINLDGRFVDVNERACKNLGYTREELLTKSVWDIAIGLSPEKLETIWAQMEPDVPITLEGTHRRKDGTTFPVEVRVCSFELDNRQHTLCLARDITERKQAEEELRTSEERFRSLYNNHTPVMMHLVDWDGNLVNVNDYWLEVLGYERGEVIGRKSTDFLTEESRRHAIEVAMPEFLKTGFAKDVEYHMVKKNGEVIDVLLSAIADRDREGRINYSLAFIVDVTERKKAEKALRESEERFHKIFDHSNDSVFVIDPKKDKILDANS
ncbi:MAG: PAS domain-containing protein, partial [Candidatus Poribacteria bacterium]